MSVVKEKGSESREAGSDHAEHCRHDTDMGFAQTQGKPRQC